MTPVSDSIKSYFGEPSIGLWESETHGAAAFRVGAAIRLDVARKDKSSGMDWDELREIKKACGFGDRDAIEFYPRETDVMNTANVRHLFIFDKALPFIWRNDGR